MDDETKIDVIIADDHQVVRAGIKRLMSVEKSIRIIAEAGNGQDAVDLITHYKPDVALIDIFMPRLTGVEVVKEIKEKAPEVFAVILTAFEDSQHLEEALRAGADGYLAKDIGFRELIDAVINVTKGERVFSHSIIKILNKKYKPGASDEKQVIITKREQEILNLVADGYKNSEIAEKFDISIRTVESHRYNLMHKLDIKNTAEMIRFALMRSNPGNK